jgi:hypothetical protein
LMTVEQVRQEVAVAEAQQGRLGAQVCGPRRLSHHRHRGVGGRDGLTRAGCVRASWLATGEQAAPPPEP